MKFQTILDIFREQMAGANPFFVFLGLFLFTFIMSFILWRWGAGFLMSLVFIFLGLIMVRSSALAGIALIGRFVLACVLTLYAIFIWKNKLSFSWVVGLLFLTPVVMMVNSVRSPESLDAFGQGVIFLLFYVGVILGGQKIFGDARGRATFTKFVVFFTILMSCIQLPFWSSASGRLEGAFENVVGFMLVGTAGVIILVWMVLKQKVWSGKFFFFLFFALLTLILLILTAGRTALGAVTLGVLVLLVRRLKRNIIISLVLLVIFAPLGLKIITSFPGLESVRGKLFSRESSGRAELWKVAFNEIKKKPLYGWGTGSAHLKGKEIVDNEFHNSYLEYAIEHGVPLAVALLLVYIWLPFRGLYLMRKCNTEEMKDMAILSSAFLSAYVFSSFLGGVLMSTTGILPVYTAIALQEGVCTENREIEKYAWIKYGEEDFGEYDYIEMLSEQPLGFYESN